MSVTLSALNDSCHEPKRNIYMPIWRLRNLRSAQELCLHEPQAQFQVFSLSASSALWQPILLSMKLSILRALFVVFWMVWFPAVVVTALTSSRSDAHASTWLSHHAPDRSPLSPGIFLVFPATSDIKGIEGAAPFLDTAMDDAMFASSRASFTWK